MNSIGGGLSALGAGKGSLSLSDVVKNPALQALINGGIASLSLTTAANNQNLADYINRYMANYGQAKSYAAQEGQTLDQFYNGTMEGRLAALRTNYQNAVNNAADVAAGQATRNANLATLVNPGGSSSYSQRMNYGLLAPIRTQAAVDVQNQARGDQNYLTQNQLGLIGQRQNLANTLASYTLAPISTRSNVAGTNFGLLSNAAQVNDANNFFGVKYNESPLERWGNVMSAVGTGANNDMSMGLNLARGISSFMPGSTPAMTQTPGTPAPSGGGM